MKRWNAPSMRRHFLTNPRWILGEVKKNPHTTPPRSLLIFHLASECTLYDARFLFSRVAHTNKDCSSRRRLYVTCLLGIILKFSSSYRQELSFRRRCRMTPKNFKRKWLAIWRVLLASVSTPDKTLKWSGKIRHVTDLTLSRKILVIENFMTTQVRIVRF